MPEVTVKTPNRLVSMGGGRVVFSVEIVGNEYRDWDRTCRVGSLADARFGALPVVQMVLPGDVGGEPVAVLEFSDERRGRRLSGAFRLRIDRRETSSQSLVLGNQHAEGAGVIYQPIEVKGVEAKEVRQVGDHALIPVPLEEERPGAGIPLGDLLEREAVIPLPEAPGCPVRVFQLRVDRNLILGRCYAKDLNGSTLAMLQRFVSPPRAHWITTWDDVKVNRVSALLGHSSKDGMDQLAVHNITDHARHGTPLAVLTEDEAEMSVAPGDTLRVGLEPERDVAICVGEGTARRTLVRVSFQEAIIQTASGPVPVPVLQTVETSFMFPPAGGDGSVRVHFLGVWIPLTPKRLRDLLQDAGDSVHVDFREDDFRLRFSSDHRAVMVASNVDLRACMAG